MKGSTTQTASIDRILVRIQGAIAALPLETMIHSVRYPGEPASESVSEMEWKAGYLLKNLAVLASLGNEDAARSLRNLGNLAAIELDALVQTPPAATPAQAVEKATAGPPHRLEVFSLPVVEIRGDLSPIKKILRDEEKAIETFSAEEISGRVEALGRASHRRYVVNALRSLGFSVDILDQHVSRTSEASVHYNHPYAILEQQHVAIEGTKGEPAAYRRKKRALIAMYQAIGSLMEFKLATLSPNTASGLAPKSLDWPLSVSAFQIDLMQRHGSLQLGTCMAFRPRPSGKQAVGEKDFGKVRFIEPGTPAAFALEYCIELDNVRRANIDASGAQKKTWEEWVAGIEVAISDRKASELITMPDPNNPFNGQSLRSLWTLKSALLPDFPSECPKEDQKAATDLGLWVDAAFARARVICWNDWENYGGWPKCVQTRCAQNAVRKRTAESVVREKLKEGMMRLEPKPPII